METFENDALNVSETASLNELERNKRIVDKTTADDAKSTKLLEAENESQKHRRQVCASSVRRNKNYYKCSRCPTTSVTFSSSKALQTHHLTCHSLEIKYECHKCGHHFKQKIESAKSARTVYTQTGLDYFICEVCCKRLASFAEVEQHKALEHRENYKVGTPEDRFSCKYCDKIFQFRSLLVNHEMIHTGEKPHACPYCSKTFRRKGQLDVHVNIHTKQTIYMCGECDARFYQATTLHHHLRSRHQQWRHECQYCKKLHVTKRDKEEHERTHTGKKPYTCEHCGAGFPRKQNLDNHLKAHRNERSFTCTECGKSFFRKSTLKEHFRTHTGEKPYQCQRCQKRFTQKSHLRGHLRSHLRQELEKHQPIGVEPVTADTVDKHQPVEIEAGTSETIAEAKIAPKDGTDHPHQDYAEVNLPAAPNDEEPVLLIVNTSNNDTKLENESMEHAENCDKVIVENS